MPEWEALITIISLTLVIIVTVVGNILVIISVFTYAPLKITPNYFIVSLAMADLTVSACVLPFNVVSIVLGRWVSSVLCLKCTTVNSSVSAETPKLKQQKQKKGSLFQLKSENFGSGQHFDRKNPILLLLLNMVLNGNW